MEYLKTDNSLKYICFFLIASTVVILYWLFKYSVYGLDFTDEGGYLNWISDPFLYKHSLSQFGYIYYPFYNLVDGNIAWLRKFNFFITFILYFTLIYLLINRLIDNKILGKIFQLTLISGLAVSVFTILNIATPSYNYLNAQGLIITCIGILLIDITRLNKNILAYTLIGIGTWITFMAKPSSAIGLALIILFYLIISKQFQLRFILLSLLVAFFLLIISALVIDNSLSLFLKRYLISFELLKLLKSNHELNTIFRLDELNLSYKMKKQIFFIFLISFIIIWLESKKFKFNNFIFFSTCFIIFFIVISLVFIKFNWSPNFGNYKNYQLFGITFACMLTSAFYAIKKKINIDDIQWSLFLLFLSIPYVYALGTGNNYWYQGGQVLFFWLLSGFILIIPISVKLKLFKTLFFLILFSQLIISINIKERNEKPYRYNEPLRLSNSKLVTDDKNYNLIVSKEFADYVNDARKIANASGFKRKNPIIDLSGQSPGLVYLMGAKSIGAAWIIGGRYEGALNLAKANFSLVGCEEIGNSWVLYEKKGPRSISTELLISLGANFPKHYEIVGSWKTAIGAGGHKYQRIQELYKPIEKKQIIDTCNLLRSKKNKLN